MGHILPLKCCLRIGAPVGAGILYAPPKFTENTPKIAHFSMSQNDYFIIQILETKTQGLLSFSNGFSLEE
jgi:hypothetical protein